MRYILDFDHTLMDTDRFVAQVDADGRRDILVTPQIWEHYNARDFLYDDVLDFLQAKNPADIHILTAMTPSLGDEACDFQREKLRNVAIDDLVEGITLMVGDKGPYIAELYDGRPTCFVDDSLLHHDSLQMTQPKVISLLMQRPGVTHVVPSQNAAIHTVTNLHEVDETLARLQSQA